MPRSKRLVDAALYRHAVEYRRLKAEEGAAKTLAEAERDVICAELKARKVDEWEHGGLSVKMRTARRVLSLDRAREVLARALFRRVTKTVIDPPAWTAEKAAGRITADVDEQCRVDELVTPHIYVNEVGQRKIAA